MYGLKQRNTAQALNNRAREIKPMESIEDSYDKLLVRMVEIFLLI